VGSWELKLDPLENFLNGKDYKIEFDTEIEIYKH
jgi:hypothetical protein